ncbi:TadE/TadG family type IV pilus assembly protein [Streptosporangium sp. NPDC048047]|uniref:TadE/TadG family type IV pilus assembly protein n=1 Tax=Streptosporangium sp. NPDC048047 TaxID=3155748 RepID=UPI00343DF02D
MSALARRGGRRPPRTGSPRPDGPRSGPRGRTPASRYGPRGERGSLTAETVLLAPVFLLFLLLLVGAGRLVEAQGEVNGAARDAARAASVERSFADAESAAQEAARDSLSGQCEPQVSLEGSRWEMGGRVRAEVTCSLDLSFLGFGAAKDIEGDSVVPLERFRRVEEDGG